jgi:cytochrome c oxidase subunit 2
MKKQLVALVATICASITTVSFGAEIGDAQLGKAHYSVCQNCHGTNAEGNQATGAPRLVGLQEWYLVKQLTKFRTGLRGSDPQDEFGQQMASIAKALPDEQSINDVAAYIMTLRTDPLPRIATIETPIERPNTFEHCTHCHGSKGQGINEGYTRNPTVLHPPAPSLSGQHDWYLTRQIQNFKSRIRASQLEDKEGTQCRVRGMPNLYNDEDIEEVVAYIKTLQ